MPRPQLSKRDMIDQGVEDYFDQRTYETTTKLITSDAVKRVTALVCNSLPWSEVDVPSQLWMAPSSVGIRETDAEPVARLIQEPSDIYDYTGYDVATATTVRIGSATSGATITMERAGYGDEWEAEFRDPEDKSEMYRRLFGHLGHDSLFDLTKGEIAWEDVKPYDFVDDEPVAVA